MIRNNIKTRITAGKYSRFTLIIAGIILFALSCISPFTPDYRGESDFLVVDGSLIKGYEKQVIKISRASSVSQPVYYPLKNCKVRIIDEKGNEFAFTEESAGTYVSNINDGLLTYDARYKLAFSTPTGGNYESGYQQLLRTAPVDSVYSAKENHYLPNDDKYMSGLQFYVDLDAPDNASKYYKWEILETWEIHSGFQISGVYDGKTIKFDPDHSSDSLYFCWNTKAVAGIFTYSTGSLSHNSLKKVPLHFKGYNSLDLTIKYCATVRQFALNEDAYYYWHQKEIELNESGQIYTTQPTQLKSNIFNINDPDEKVLGFFWVSSFTEKHRFEKNPFSSNEILGPETCASWGTCSDNIDDNLLNTLSIIARNTKNFPKPPVYMYYTIAPITGAICVYFSKDQCVDCRLMGGTTHKPDFWK